MISISRHLQVIETIRMALRRTLEQNEILEADLFYSKVQHQSWVNQQTLDPKALELFHQLNFQTASMMRNSPTKTISEVRKQT